jgi:threonine synthase
MIGNSSMEHVAKLKCLICGKEYDADDINYVCPDHGNEGIVDVQYDYDQIARRISQGDLLHSTDHTIWRYKPLLPVEPDATVPPLTVGWTPLYRTDRLAAELGLNHLWIKDDGRLPTASFKDRASAVAIVKAQEKASRDDCGSQHRQRGRRPERTVCQCNQPNVIFVPESAPQAKIAQLLVFGSQVVLVKGTYDDAFDLCMDAVAEYGWYNRNTGYNPLYDEGKKTVSFEISRATGLAGARPHVFVSVGDGCIIGGVHKGFKDLLALGWIDHMPKIMGVQSKAAVIICTRPGSIMKMS